MSTILKALRQLEDERTRANAADPLADPQLAPPVAPRVEAPGWQRWQAALLAGVGGALLASALVLAWLPDGEPETRPGSRLAPVSGSERAALEAAASDGAPDRRAVAPLDPPASGVPLRADGGLAPAPARKPDATDAPNRVIAVFGAEPPAGGSDLRSAAAAGASVRNRDVAASGAASTASVDDNWRAAERSAGSSASAVGTSRPVAPRERATSPSARRTGNAGRTTSDAAGSASGSTKRADRLTSNAGRTASAATREGSSAALQASRQPAGAAATRSSGATAAASVEDARTIERAETARARPPAGSTRPGPRPARPVAPAPTERAEAPNVADVEPMIPDFARSRRSGAGAAPPVVVSGTVWHPVASRRTATLVVEPGAPGREVREGDRVGSLVVLEITPSGIVFEDGGVRVTRRVGAGS